MDRLLILGVNSFSGRHFLNYIYKKGFDKKYLIYGIGSKPKYTSHNIFYQKIDVTNYDSLEKFIIENRPNYIVNFIGKFGTDNINELLKFNFDVTKNIINLIIKNKLNVKKVLLIGSAAEYGVPSDKNIKESAKLNPVNFYGLTKKIQTEFAIGVYNIENIPINIARTFNLIGDGISEILLPGKFNKLISNTKNNSYIRMKNLSNIRDYLEVEKAVEMYWTILINGAPGEVYNVCSGKGIKIRDILLKLIKESDKKINIIEDKEFYSINDVKKIVGSNQKIIDLMRS